MFFVTEKKRDLDFSTEQAQWYYTVNYPAASSQTQHFCEFDILSDNSMTISYNG